MSNIRDYQMAQVFCGLFKGPPGTGKTVAAGSFPDPYFISTDGKVGSLKLFYPDKNIEYDIFNDYWGVFQKLESLQNDCPYKTIIVDGLTKLSMLAMMHSMNFRVEDRKDAGKNAKEQMGKHRGELLLPEIEDYNAESMGLYQIIYKLKALSAQGINTILTAHILVTEYKDLQMRTKITKTLLTGGKKVAAGIPGEFDEMYHFRPDAAFEGGGVGFHVLTQNDGEDEARSALPLPKDIDITNCHDFYGLLMSSITNSQAFQTK